VPRVLGAAASLFSAFLSLVESDLTRHRLITIHRFCTYTYVFDLIQPSSDVSPRRARVSTFASRRVASRRGAYPEPDTHRRARHSTSLGSRADRDRDIVQVERVRRARTCALARRRPRDAREAVVRRRESAGIQRSARCAMDPYNADPYAPAPVRYPTTSYVTVSPTNHGSAVMAGAYDGQRGAPTPSSTGASGTKAAKPSEIPGAPAGNVRYRCMSLPTADDDDIEDVIVQMGLDGVKCFAGGDVTRTKHTFELPRISKWSVVDSTILTIHAKDSSGERAVSVSADSGTISALVDVLTTSAFQWCELNGFDAMDTIVSSGSEWTNLKASNASPGTASTSNVHSIRFWESPEYSGWLTKQGEMLRTWRKRWFVLKEGYLVWFKTNVVNDRSVSRGTIPLDAIESITAASEVVAGRPFAILLGGALPERIGAKFLVADSDRERAQWIEALQNAMRNRSSSSQAGESSSAEQLRQGFAHVSTPPFTTAPAARFPDTSNIQIEVQDYASPRTSQPQNSQSQGSAYVSLPPLPFAHPSTAAGAAAFEAPPSAPESEYYSAAYGASNAQSDWTTYHTPEGKPYYYNRVTGVTSWDPPR